MYHSRIPIPLVRATPFPPTLVFADPPPRFAAKVDLIASRAPVRTRGPRERVRAGLEPRHERSGECLDTRIQPNSIRRNIHRWQHRTRARLVKRTKKVVERFIAMTLSLNIIGRLLIFVRISIFQMYIRATESRWEIVSPNENYEKY